MGLYANWEDQEKSSSALVCVVKCFLFLNENITQNTEQHNGDAFILHFLHNLFQIGLSYVQVYTFSNIILSKYFQYLHVNQHIFGPGQHLRTL